MPPPGRPTSPHTRTRWWCSAKPSSGSTTLAATTTRASTTVLNVQMFTAMLDAAYAEIDERRRQLAEATGGQRGNVGWGRRVLPEDANAAQGDEQPHPLGRAPVGRRTPRRIAGRCDTSDSSNAERSETSDHPHRIDRFTAEPEDAGSAPSPRPGHAGWRGVVVSYRNDVDLRVDSSVAFSSDRTRCSRHAARRPRRAKPEGRRAHQQPDPGRRERAG